MKSNISSRRSRNDSTFKACASQSTSPKICDLHSFPSREIENIRQQLLKWYEMNKRQLPWRTLSAQALDKNRRGYAVWVSEVMLQQTQVATVTEYYNRWMKRWPTLQDLANASLEEVNEMWAGLGYYSRARRLHEGSNKVVSGMKGEMPGDAASLMKSLPGVGKYTAAAIASIAFNEPVGLVDGNVVRVLSRLRIIGADSSSMAAVEMFWRLADELVDKDHPGDFNQALMELGATICTPKSPHCEKCPVGELCLAYKQVKSYPFTAAKNGNEIRNFFDSDKPADCSKKALPDIEELIANDCKLCLSNDSTWDSELGVCNYSRKAKPKEARQEKVAVCILEWRSKAGEDILLFLTKRSSSGLLAGLWEFPNLVVDNNSSEQELVTKLSQFMKKQFMFTLPKNEEPTLLGHVVHLFSHIHHTYVVHKIVLTAEPNTLTGESANDQNTKWVRESEFLKMAVSTAMKKVYNVYKNDRQPKKAGVKRKREEKDGKRQKVLDSFFLKS